MEALSEYACTKFLITKEIFNDFFEKAKLDIKKQLGNVGASHNRMLYMQLFLEQIGEKPVIYALELYDIYWNTFLKNMKVFPYVYRLFDELRNRNISIFMLTDLTACIQHRKLKEIKLDEYINIIVSSEEAGAEKPAKIAFERLLSKVKYDPDELLMIGDSLVKDIDGAQNCGLNALHFRKEYQNDMDKRSLDFIDEINKLV